MLFFFIDIIVVFGNNVILMLFSLSFGLVVLLVYLFMKNFGNFLFFFFVLLDLGIGLNLVLEVGDDSGLLLLYIFNMFFLLFVFLVIIFLCFWWLLFWGVDKSCSFFYVEL